MNDDEVKKALVDHYSYASKLGPAMIRALLELRSEFAYLVPAPAKKIYRGIANLTLEQAQEFQEAMTSFADVDLSWSLSLEVAWRFARSEWSAVDPVPGRYAVVLVAKMLPLHMLLDFTQTAALAGVGDWEHDVWKEALAGAIKVEQELLTTASLGLTDVLIEANPLTPVEPLAKRIARSLHPHEFTMTDAKTPAPRSVAPAPVVKTLPVPTPVPATKLAAGPSVEKAGLLEGSLVAGVHIHNWDDDEGATAIDGAHRHEFALPDGSLVETEIGGWHQHRAYEGASYLWGGPHVHLIALPDGTFAWTEISGEHEHSLQETNTLIDGPHEHTLVLSSGATIESLGVHERPSQAMPAPPAEELFKSVPSLRKRERAVWSMAPGPAVEVRMSHGKGWVGWRLADGGAQLLAYDDAAWVPTAADSVSPEGVEHTHVSKGWVEQGLRGADYMELFFEGSHASQMVLRQNAAQGRVRVTMDSSGPPLAYSTGVPGPVPSSLAKQMPADLRWWDAPTEAEAAMRLVKARELGALDLVDASSGTWLRLAKITQVQPVTLGGGDDLLDIMKAALPSYEVAPVLTHRVSKNMGDTAFVLLDADAEGWGLRKAVGTARAVGKPTACVSKDGHEPRTALASLGYLYAVRSDKAAGLVVGSTVALLDPRLVRVTARALAPTPAGEQPAAPVLPDASTVAKALRQCKEVKLTKGLVPLKKLVYGIVLEPGTVDAQNDTIDVDTIEVAAHGYLALNKNAGFMHEFLINEHAQVVESYIAPIDMVIGETTVAKGTWIMVMKILDESLWADVESGAIGGFSIGGMGARVPV